MKQGQSSTPADILVDIFNSYNSEWTELGIKLSTRISAGVADCPCFTTFITMIPIDYKIRNFSLHLVNC